MLKSYFQWTNHKNKTIILGMLGLCLITAAAFVLPTCFFAYYDTHSGDSISYLESDVSVYSVQYGSFKEKLHAISSCYENQTSMNLFCVQEEADDETKELLDSKLESEFRFWEEGGLRVLDIMDFLAEAQMTESRLYTAYPAEDTKEQTGITYWKLAYKDVEGRELSVLMDAEFQKLYAIKLSTGFEGIEALKRMKEEMELSVMVNSDNSRYYDFSYEVMNFLIQYYELAEDYYPYGVGTENVIRESVSFVGGSGIIDYENENRFYFPLGCWYTISEEKNLYFNIGIYPKLGEFLQL